MPFAAFQDPTEEDDSQHRPLRHQAVELLSNERRTLNDIEPQSDNEWGNHQLQTLPAVVKKHNTSLSTHKHKQIYMLAKN